jgi:hypothetical protein
MYIIWIMAGGGIILLRKLTEHLPYCTVSSQDTEIYINIHRENLFIFSFVSNINPILE